jgi:TRAP-type C4-dicarboxylate transport system permease small subunit
VIAVSRLKQPAWSARVGQVPALLAVGAGICLVAMVAVVALGVILRYVVGNPIMGVNEIVQLIAVALAMLALPYCTSSGTHVSVDLFDRPLGRWGRLFGDLLSRCLSVVALFFLCRQAWTKAAKAVEFGDVTNMLQLPLWPIYGAIFAGMALCGLVYAVEVFALIVGRRRDDD